jgi:hypothetical protein
MGNTSNPVINRVGIIQPWSTNYITSKKSSFKSKWVNSLTTLLTSYMLYGVNFQSNIFLHEYWYKKNKALRNLPSKMYMQYYKRFFYTNSTLSIEHSFLIRKKTNEFFNFRPWVFLYNNWFIVIICWYKPPKPHNSAMAEDTAFSDKVVSRKNKITKSIKVNTYSKVNTYRF